MLEPRSLLLTPFFIAIGSTWVTAQQVDLAFAPDETIVQVGDPIRIQLLTIASGVQPVPFAALDALLDYDPAFVALLGVDDTDSAENWFVSSFLPDPDGINDDLTDGNAIYTALAHPSTPAQAQPSGSLVTTLEFVALAETPGTPLSLLPNLGTYGLTAVYAPDVPGGVITGDISETAIIRILPEPQAFCFGEPVDCPCGNEGTPGAGCLNSTGVGGLLQFSGSASVTQDDLILTASGLNILQFGVFIVGGGQNNLPFGDGLRCVSPGPTGLNRFNPPDASGATGVMTRGPGIVAYSQANFPIIGQIAAGGTYYFQAWYRDPGGPCGSGFNLTNGLAIAFTP